MERLPRHSLGVINGHTFKDVISIEKPNDHVRSNGHEQLEVIDLKPVWLSLHNGTEFTIAEEHENDDLPGVLAITVNERIVAGALKAVLKDGRPAVVCSKKDGDDTPREIVAEPIIAKSNPLFNHLHPAA